MEKRLYDILDEVMSTVKDYAEESYDAGQPMDYDDLREFTKIISEEDSMKKLMEALFDYYFESYNNYRSEE